jgi:hypothetical protein
MIMSQQVGSDPELPFLAPNQDGTQVESPQPGLGQLIRHQSESVEDISAGFQYAPFQQSNAGTKLGPTQANASLMASCQHTIAHASAREPAATAAIPHSESKNTIPGRQLPAINRYSPTSCQRSIIPPRAIKAAQNVDLVDETANAFRATQDPINQDELASDCSMGKLSAVKLVQTGTEGDGGNCNVDEDICDQGRSSLSEYHSPQTPQNCQPEMAPSSQEEQPTQRTFPWQGKGLVSYPTTK